MTKIKNDYQLAASKTWLREFEEALKEAEQDSELTPRLRDAHVDSIQSQMRDLESEIEEYERIKDTPPQEMSIGSLEELPESLVRLRIAKDMTQADLASKLGIKQQQIQKWEASSYERAAYATVLKVAKALGVEIEGRVVR